MEGVWKIGEKLPSENELCATFGVSRVTVRAAIQQLEILGLVETKHGGGTFVKDFSAIDSMDALHPFVQLNRNQDVITVLEYRKVIEKGAIGLAASKITKEDLAFLEKTLASMKANKKDPEKIAEADLAFHYRIAEIARNPILSKVYALINEILSSAMFEIVTTLGMDLGLQYHKKLIDALKSGDKTLCEEVMAEHIDKTIEAFVHVGEERWLPDRAPGRSC